MGPVKSEFPLDIPMPIITMARHSLLGYVLLLRLVTSHHECTGLADPGATITQDRLHISELHVEHPHFHPSFGPRI